MAFSAVLASGAAFAEPCKLGRAGELPVTMEGMQPLVHASINGEDALFMADSGAFFSILTAAAARHFNLSLEHAAPGFAITGVGGDAQTWVTTVRTFRIFSLDLPKVPFLVVGNDVGHGAVGVLGQNVFSLGDVEYDLANGIIRILRTRGDCRQASLAYWANAKGLSYSQIDIAFARAENPRTTGDAYVNGSKIRVEFDTGASASMLTLDAARRAGVTPDSPGVTAGGAMSGNGSRTLRTWIAPFASFRIGDEEIRNTHLRIGDLRQLGIDMLIGADFFLSHHILAANSQDKLYFTYNGGPVFNLTTTGTPSPSAAEPGVPATSQPDRTAAAGAGTQAAPEGQLDAAALARRGSASASRRDYEPAIADLSKAIELDPTQADFFYERGKAYGADNLPDKALEDLSQAIRLKPNDVPALLARAELLATRKDSLELVTADLDAVDRAAPKQADVRLTLGGLYPHVGNYSAAVAQYDDWIDARDSDDVQMPSARNARCWARALAGRELDKALDDCNFALRKRSKVPAFLDSRGFVYLRLGKYAKAIGDYDAALALDPKIAWSLYGRGLAKQHLGQTAAADADIAAAKALSPKIAEAAASLGIAP
jgi:tetratricopeptide (TPR) repeat protein/predicted aspartyl protease